MAKKYITVLSDTHGNLNLLKRLQGDFISSDFIVHLGDGVLDMQDFYLDYFNKILQVDGNCDFVKSGNDELIFSVDGVKILAVHGHKFSVKSGIDRLVDYASEKGCNVVLYGHTHFSKIERIKDIYLINPGTLSYGGNEQSIARLKIENGIVDAKIIKVNNKF